VRHPLVSLHRRRRNRRKVVRNSGRARRHDGDGRCSPARRPGVPESCTPDVRSRSVTWGRVE